MTPYFAENLDAMRARLPAALSRTYDALEIEAGRLIRPGEQRQHVFDFEDGIRCIVSLDVYPEDSASTLPARRVLLHMSFSSQLWIKLNIDEFFARTEAIPTEFWPDTMLVLVNRFMTEQALHLIFDVPRDWKRFYEVCASTPKTASSAG